MRGTVTKKRDRWYICYYIGKDAKGKWKQKWEGSWDTKKAAEKVLRQRITELEETFERKGESSTLKVYLQNWLDTYCTERLAPNTIRGYRVNVEKHIAPYIGQIRLNDLKPSDIQGLYSKLLAQGLSGTTVRYVHNNLHRALSVAVRQQLLTRNPADCVEPPVIDHYEAATLNDKQVRQLLTACRGTEIYVPVRRWACNGRMWIGSSQRFLCAVLHHSVMVIWSWEAPKQGAAAERCCCPLAWPVNCGKQGMAACRISWSAVALTAPH